MVNYSQIHRAVSALSKYYKTNVLGFYLGDTLTIVAKDTASVKEILLNQAFDGRSDLLITQVRDPERSPRGFEFMIDAVAHGIKCVIFAGIFFLTGPPWKEQRRFTLRYLRDFGFGRRFSTFEAEINDELLTLIDMLKNGTRYPHERVCLDVI